MVPGNCETICITLITNATYPHLGPQFGNFMDGMARSWKGEPARLEPGSSESAAARDDPSKVRVCVHMSPPP